MYGLRSIHAPVEQYLALSSGPGSIATSGAVPLLIARRMAEGSLPPTVLTVIHGAVFFKPSRTLLSCLSSRPVKKLQTVSVTGLCELFGGGELLDPPPAVHAVAIRVRPMITGTARRFIPHLQLRWRNPLLRTWPIARNRTLAMAAGQSFGCRQTRPEPHQTRRRKWEASSPSSAVPATKVVAWLRFVQDVPKDHDGRGIPDELPRRGGPGLLPDGQNG